MFSALLANRRQGIGTIYTTSQISKSDEVATGTQILLSLVAKAYHIMKNGSTFKIREDMERFWGGLAGLRAKSTANANGTVPNMAGMGTEAIKRRVHRACR